MKIALFANIGNRDVLFQDKSLTCPRVEGEKHLKKLKKSNEMVDFSIPILQPAIEHILKSHASIDLITLICTDQDKDQTKEDNWNRDTLFLAEIIETLIKRGQFQDKVKALNIEKITQNPSDYDLMFNYYESFLSLFARQNRFQIVFLCTSGGVAACNSNMILHGSRIFGETAQVLYISEKEGVKPLNIAQSISDDYTRKACLTLLERSDYTGLAGILEDNNFGSDFLKDLTRYCAARLIFDFKTAKEYLSKVRDDFQKFGSQKKKRFDDGLKKNAGLSVQQGIDESLKTLDMFTQELPVPRYGSSDEQWKDWLIVQKQLIAELVTNIEIKWQTGNYVDFIGRVFRFAEAVLRWIFESKTHYSADTDRYRNEFEKFLQVKRGQALKEKLAQKGLSERINIHTLNLWLEVECSGNLNSNFFPIWQIMTNIEKLTGLRNKSITAHGYLSVTKEEITNIYGRENPLEDFIAILNYLGMPFKSDFIKRSSILIRLELAS